MARENARAIVRWSLDGTHGVSTHLGQILKRNGFDNHGTGSYERTGPLINLVAALEGVLHEVRRIDKETPAKLDHLWIYIDQPGKASTP